MDGAVPGDGHAATTSPHSSCSRAPRISSCGTAKRGVGPFYCPGDRKVYLDTDFFRELQGRFGAPGDFAAAYVIAHEIGHHVQNQLGTMQKFDQAAARMDLRQRNAPSVRLELQADCYAGVWGTSRPSGTCWSRATWTEACAPQPPSATTPSRRRREGRIVPDAFTHGTAAQRARWFRTGLKSGDPRTCNTFAAKDL